jgi:hypothetical protein
MPNGTDQMLYRVLASDQPTTVAAARAVVAQLGLDPRVRQDVVATGQNKLDQRTFVENPYKDINVTGINKAPITLMGKLTKADPASGSTCCRTTSSRRSLTRTPSSTGHAS